MEMSALNKTMDRMSIEKQMERDPFDILPEELWEHIFGCIENSQDWLNLSRSSLGLQTLMEKKKPVVLFPEVIRDIAGFGYLGHKDLLSCRAACKSFRKGVDSVNENHLKEMSIWSDNPKPPFISLSMEFTSSQRIDSFLEDMATHIGSPFVGGQLKFRFSSSVGLEEWFIGHRMVVPEIYSSSEKLLERFGKYVEYLSVSVDYEDMDQLLLTIWLNACLKLVPNVKALEVDFHVGDFPLAEIRNLPQLTKLKCLISPMGETSFRSIMSVIPCPENLTKIQLKYLPSNISESFPNVKVLSTILNSTNLNVIGRCEQWRFLESLHLYLYDSESACLFRDICSAVNRFGESLVKFVLNENVWAEKTDKLNLPKLKQLQIEELHGSLDFLLELQSLEELTIGEIRDLNENQELAELVNENEKPSKIWKIFPKLQFFRSKSQYFTRSSLVEGNEITSD